MGGKNNNRALLTKKGSKQEKNTWKTKPNNKSEAKAKRSKYK